jgi:vitamin B12 transporter
VAKDTRTAFATSVSLEPGAALTMVDALRARPGVHIDQPGGPGGRSSRYLQGGEEDHTVVLLDGVPVNNSTNSRDSFEVRF